MQQTVSVSEALEEADVELHLAKVISRLEELEDRELNLIGVLEAIGSAVRTLEVVAVVESSSAIVGSPLYLAWCSVREECAKASMKIADCS